MRNGPHSPSLKEKNRNELEDASTITAASQELKRRCEASILTAGSCAVQDVAGIWAQEFDHMFKTIHLCLSCPHFASTT